MVNLGKTNNLIIMQTSKLNTEMIDNIVFENVDRNDHPDYSDVFISHAEVNGVPLTDKELDELNQDSSFVHERLLEVLN